MIEQFRADKKRTVVTPSEADLSVIRAVSEKVTADWAAKDPHTRSFSPARELCADQGPEQVKVIEKLRDQRGELSPSRV